MNPRSVKQQQYVLSIYFELSIALKTRSQLHDAGTTFHVKWRTQMLGLSFLLMRQQSYYIYQEVFILSLTQLVKRKSLTLFPKLRAWFPRVNLSSKSRENKIQHNMAILKQSGELGRRVRADFGFFFFLSRNKNYFHQGLSKHS